MAILKYTLIAGVVVFIGAWVFLFGLFGIELVKGIKADSEQSKRSAQNFPAVIAGQKKRCSTRTKQDGSPPLSEAICNCVVDKSAAYSPLPREENIISYINSHEMGVEELKNIPSHLFADVFFYGRTSDHVLKIKYRVISRRKRENLKKDEFEKLLSEIHMRVMNNGLGDCAPSSHFTDYSKFEEESKHYFILSQVNASINGIKKLRKKMNLTD